MTSLISHKVKILTSARVTLSSLALVLITGCSLTRLTSCEKPRFIDGEINKNGYQIAAVEDYRQRESNIVDTVKFAESLPEQRAIIAGWGDKVYIQRYLHGYNGTDLLNLKSVSKVFISLLFGILLDEKKLDTLDVPVSTYLTDYFANVPADDPKRKMTIRQLLTMSSGLKKHFTYKEIPATELDWVKYILSEPLDFQPGEKFDYNCVNSHVLIAVLEKIIQTDIYEYLKQKVLVPLEFTETKWSKDPSGRYIGGSDFYMRPVDLLAIVRMYMNGGMYGDRRIVSEEWVTASTTKVHDSAEASFIRIGYGTHWWTAESRDASLKVFFESGLGGQMLHITPKSRSFLILAFDVPPDAELTYETQQSNVANFFQLLYY